jgi:hypothetical protein
MIRSNLIFVKVLLVFLIWLTLPVYAFSQHHVYLEVPNSIPCYCQENNIRCGAATAQMLLEGYPAGVEHAFDQSDIWDVIQTHKDDPSVNWATDPDGLREALMELGGDPGVNWAIHTNSTASSLMYTVAYWMTKRQFPSAVLVYGWQHWIAITGLTTDVDPTTNSTVSLEYIEIMDPWNPPCPTASSGGAKSWMSGSTWYNDYWYAVGNYPTSKWHGNFIAVIEPPINRGTAKAPEQIAKGEIIPDSLAISRALSSFKELGLYERKPYSILRKSKPLKPYLVNNKYKGYYIVPFGYKENNISQGAIIVNAYTGEFQEVSYFENPVTYLTEEQAKKIALNSLCWCGSRAKAELIFEPSMQTTSRLLPVWKITATKRSWIFFTRTATVYVNQWGEVFDKLIPLPLGD